MPKQFTQSQQNIAEMMADRIDSFMALEVERLAKIVAETPGVGAESAHLQAKEIGAVALYLSFERRAYRLAGRVPPHRRTDNAGGGDGEARRPR